MPALCPLVLAVCIRPSSRNRRAGGTGSVDIFAEKLQPLEVSPARLPSFLPASPASLSTKSLPLHFPERLRHCRAKALFHSIAAVVAVAACPYLAWASP